MSKEVWLAEKVVPHDFEWYWIDDMIEENLERIKACGLPVERCVQVSPRGADVLRELREELSEAIESVKFPT